MLKELLLKESEYFSFSYTVQLHLMIRTDLKA